MSFSAKSQHVGGGCPPGQSMSQMNNNQQNDGLQGNNVGGQNPAANLLAAQSGLQSNLTANFVAQHAANAHLANLTSSQLGDVPSLVPPLSLANMTLQQQQQLQPLMQMLFNQPQFQNVLQNQPKLQPQQQFQQLGGVGEPLSLTRMFANVTENLQSNKQANGSIAAVSAAIQAQLPSQTTLMLSSSSSTQNFQQQKTSNRPNVTLTKTSVTQQQVQQHLPPQVTPPVAPPQTQPHSVSQEQPPQHSTVVPQSTNNNNNHDQPSPSKPVPLTPKNAQANYKNLTTPTPPPSTTVSSNATTSSSLTTTTTKQNSSRNSNSHPTATPSTPTPPISQSVAPSAAATSNTTTNIQKLQVTSPPTGATPTITKTTAAQPTLQRSPMKLATISAPRIKQQNARKSNVSSVTKSPASASTATATTSATPPSASASTSNQSAVQQKEKVGKEKDKEKDHKEKEAKEKDHKEIKEKDHPVAASSANSSVTAAIPKSSKAACPVVAPAPIVAAPTLQTPDDSREKRKRIRTTPYQSPIPELALISKLTAIEVSSPRSVSSGVDADKLTLFYKNEFLAVRNADDGFFLCQTLHNIYKSAKPCKIRIRWLSEKGKDQNYQLDFYDYTDMECILTNVELKKIDKQTYKLPSHELERVQNILKKAIDVEKGILPRPDVTAENPDGLDLSIYTSESQLEKKSPQKRKADSSLPLSPKAKSTPSVAKKAKINSPVHVVKQRPSSRKSGKISYAEDPSDDEEFDESSFLQSPNKSKRSDGNRNTLNSKATPSAPSNKTSKTEAITSFAQIPEKKLSLRAVSATNIKGAVIEKSSPVATTVSRADRAKRRSVIDETPDVPTKKIQTSTSSTISTSSPKSTHKKSPSSMAIKSGPVAATTNISKAKSKAPVDPLAISDSELPTIVVKSTVKNISASKSSSPLKASTVTTTTISSTSSNRRSGRK